MELKELNTLKKRSAWEESDASNTRLVYQAETGDDVKKPEMVLDRAWEWFGTWNQFTFLVACKCLQSQLQVLLCTMSVWWYLYHDLGILL